MAAAASWPFAVLAAGAVSLGGASVMVPLCLASGARLPPTASEAVLARLSLFDFVGVVTGGAVGGLLGSTGQFRLASAAPAATAVLLLNSRPTFYPAGPGLGGVVVRANGARLPDPAPV